MPTDRTFASSPLTFQVLRKLSDVTPLAPKWNSLLELSHCNRAFSSPEWFIATCRHNPSLQPNVIIARRGNALAGILPLVLTNRARVAAFPNYLTDYSDAIAPPNDPAVVTGLLNYACSAQADYERVVLSNIRQDSNCLQAIQVSAAHAKSFREIVVCHYLRLPASHDDFLRGKGSRFRKRLKRLQCLADKSNLSLRELEPVSFPPHKLPEVFLKLHLERRLVKSCFESRSAQAFVREVVPSLFQQGAIRACALFEMDRILAIDLYTMGSNSLCAWNGGFLSEAEPYSPGKLLINAGIKLALALTLEEYDFMRGPEAYKTSWANQSRSVGRLEISVARKH